MKDTVVQTSDDARRIGVQSQWRKWEHPTLTHVGRLGDIMQGGQSTKIDGGNFTAKQ